MHLNMYRPHKINFGVGAGRVRTHLELLVWWRGGGGLATQHIMICGSTSTSNSNFSALGLLWRCGGFHPSRLLPETRIERERGTEKALPKRA